MAIAFDAASESFSNSTLSLSWSHTCTGSNLILWVYTMHNSANTITGVTYNGVSMTSYVADALTQRSTLWYLVNPTTGTNTITVTLSGSSSYCYTAAASYTGVAQTTPTDASTTASAAAASLTSTLTTVTNNDWCILGARQQSSGSTTASTNATQRAAGSAGTIQLYDSNAAVTPAGSFSMTTTQSATGTTGHVMAAFKPFVGAATVFPSLSLMGIGS